MRSELTEFLEDIWQDGGRIFLAWKSNPSSFDVPPPKSWPADSEKIVNFLLATAARRKDVYFAPPIYIPTAVSKTSENVLHSHVLYCEFDGSAEDGLRLLADHSLPAPSYRLQSSIEGREQWYWKLDKPAIVSEFEPLNKRITYALNADKSGWDAAQLLRPPFTSNCKPEYGEPQPVLILEKTGKVYSLADFDVTPDVKSSIVENTTTTEKLGELPTIGEVLGKYKWDNQHLDLFNNPPDVKGSRDESLMRLAYYCAEVGMPDEAMYVVLDDVSRRLNKFLRPDRERQLASLMSRAREKHPFAGIKTVESNEDIQQVFTINELLNAEFQLDWLVENLIPKGTINFISAESGIGKSRITLQLAEALASGSNFMEWPIDRKIKTMYLSLEMDRYMLKHFSEGLSGGKDYSQDISDNLLLVPVGNPISLVSEDGIKYLEYLLETHQPEILFIDALGSLTLGELSEVEAKGIMSKLKGFINEYGTTFYIIHHNRKPEKSNSKSAPTLADVYGNQYIVTDAALVLTLWQPDNQSHVELITLKSRARKSDKSIVLDGSRGFHFLYKGEKTEDEEQIGKEFEDSYSL